MEQKRKEEIRKSIIACDKVSVLAGELEADKVAAVIKALSVYKVILVLHPAGGLDLADALPLLCRHEVYADAGLCHAASAKAVQIAVIFIGISGVFVLGEGGLVPVDHGVGAGPVIVRDDPYYKDFFINTVLHT